MYVHVYMCIYKACTHTCMVLILQACQTEQGLTDVAAAAQQFQPKGITLSTTEVIH